MSPDTASIEFVTLFAAALPDEIHPAGHVTILEWLLEAQRALDAGDNAEASRLLRMVNEKAALELGWYAQGLDLGAEAVADVTRRASLGDIVGAAALLRGEINVIA